VVLRLGPRTALVQADHLEIIGLNHLALTMPPSPGHPTHRIQVEPPQDRSRPAAAAAAIVPAPAPAVWPMTIPLEDATNAVMRIEQEGVAGARLRICHGPSVTDFQRSRELARALRALGARQVEVSDQCGRAGFATISRI